MKIKDLVWMDLQDGRFVAWPVLGDIAIVRKSGTTWEYVFADVVNSSYDTAKQAQDACNAEHKRLIAEWVS